LGWGGVQPKKRPPGVRIGLEMKTCAITSSDYNTLSQDTGYSTYGPLVCFVRTTLSFEMQYHSERNVVVEWLALLLRTQEVPDSNLGPETEYPEGFRSFPQSIQASEGIRR
jgi:hypothetical protein